MSAPPSSAVAGPGCLLALTVVLFGACGNRQLDAGSVHPRGLLPVDERNPLVICNDGARDGWQGEYAVALAAAGKVNLAGIVINTSSTYSNLQTNVQGWQDMTNAARASGMGDIPNPTGSAAPALVRPASGNVDDTVPNGSEGSRVIIETAGRLALPLFPMVVATGGGLTDLADAYLQDHSITDRVIVVARLGGPSSDGQGAILGNPNGAIDPWADEIVARKFRYVQVNVYYSQTADITSEVIATWPSTPFAAWMASKLPLAVASAADQVSVFASALTAFSLSVTRMSETSPAAPAAGEYPVLAPDANGNAWVVTTVDSALATAVLRQALADPATYTH